MSQETKRPLIPSRREIVIGWIIALIFLGLYLSLPNVNAYNGDVTGWTGEVRDFAEFKGNLFFPTEPKPFGARAENAPPEVTERLGRLVTHAERGNFQACKTYCARPRFMDISSIHEWYGVRMRASSPLYADNKNIPGKPVRGPVDSLPRIERDLFQVRYRLRAISDPDDDPCRCCRKHLGFRFDTK
jgi:hypothetical protein